MSIQFTSLDHFAWGLYVQLTSSHFAVRNKLSLGKNKQDGDYYLGSTSSVPMDP